LADAASTLHRAVRDCCPDAGARPVSPQDLHCTLAFLGDLGERDTGALGDALDAVDSVAFDLTFDTIESWPGPSILVACPRQAPQSLMTLQHTIAMAVIGAGLPAESRPYRPHVTVRRRQRSVSVPTPMVPCQWSLSAFVLAGLAGPSAAGRYRIVRRWALAGGNG
jgi:2'-5' RNA ligase